MFEITTYNYNTRTPQCTKYLTWHLLFSVFLQADGRPMGRPGPAGAPGETGEDGDPVSRLFQMLQSNTLNLP